MIQEEFNDSPPEVFDAFWTEFDCFYGAFNAKRINWDSLKVVCGENLNAASDNDQLFKSICKLLDALNDGHADINAEGRKYRSWNRRSKSFFRDTCTQDTRLTHYIFDCIKDNYLEQGASSGEPGDRFLKGRILYDSLVIGYLHIPTFSTAYLRSFVEQAAREFNDCDAVVIDIRFNGGGTTKNFQHALDLFCTEKKLYLKSRFRNGKRHSDLSEMFDHYTHPSSIGCKNKPVAIIANSYSSSSSEFFIKGLQSQKKVVLIGDTTCGAFSQVHSRILPNGWTFRIGSQVVYTPEGLLYTTADGKYIEGHGIVPDYYVPDNLQRAKDGHDNPLDRAIYELDRCISFSPSSPLCHRSMASRFVLANPRCFD